MRRQGAKRLLVTNIFESGADDPVFDILLVFGVVLLLVIAIVGRSLATQLLATVYVCFFVSYVVYKGL